MAKRLRSEAPPEGFRYLPGVLTPASEATVVRLMERLPWEAVIFRGYEARRRVFHFGHRYDFERQQHRRSGS